MAGNILGSPITDSTLQSMKAYSGKTITLRDRVREALASRNKEYLNAINYVEKLRQQPQGSTNGPSTLSCLIYNATGYPIILAGGRNWRGEVVGFPYPLIIENGQWGAFVHAGSKELGSSGAVVYRSVFGPWVNNYQWCFAWFTLDSSKVYCEIAGMFEYDELQWKRVEDSLHKSGAHHSCNKSGRYSVVSTSQGEVSILEALITDWPLV